MKEFDSFYNTYNARHLNPREVAESFIYSDNFEKLIQNNHSVILGARGCGKTTLMKMLTLPALHAWKGEQADNIRKNISFYAIYISTDIYWDVKNMTYSSQLQSFGTFSEQVSVFSVNNNVFKAVCESFINIIKYEIKENDEIKELELCKLLIDSWKLKRVVPKLEYIIEALNERVDYVNQIIQEVIFNYTDTDSLPKLDFFNLSFESSLENIIPIFERIYGLKEQKRWALCFDELEFAPKWLQTRLFTSLRSRTQYILYKLSASPIISLDLEKTLTKEYGATPGNDLQMIKMWSSSENEKFSKKLMRSLLSKKNEQADIEDFFGSNEIYNKSPDSYEEGSDFLQEIRELINKDDAFKQFLVQNQVDITLPLPKNNNQKDTLFRKIKPIVYFRNFYIESNKQHDEVFNIKYRSRKTNELYSGIEILSKVCDGNPRWLIGLINSILSKSGPHNVDKKTQASEIISASKRFLNVIANIPIGKGNPHTLEEIIKKIGSFFSDQLLGHSFNMDPKGTFIVNESEQEISDHIIDLLEKGTSQGVFILLDSDDDSFDFTIRNQRFKLSYLISVLYKLPLRKYPTIKLSECLTNRIDNRNIQASLF